MNKVSEVLENIDATGREIVPDGDNELNITRHLLRGVLTKLLCENLCACTNCFHPCPYTSYDVITLHRILCCSIE